MSTIERNRKVGGTNKFQTEWELGNDDIRADEVDADFDTLFDAWNTQIPNAVLGAGIPPAGPAGGDLEGVYPTPSVKSGVITRAKTASDLWLPPIPTGPDVGKILAVTAGPALSYVVAPQGPAGPPGAQGIQGNTGPQGPTGTGTQGPAGATGATGPAGATGPKGDPGAQGTQGAPGAKGDPGNTGPQGNIGPQGPQGNVGPAGPASTVPGPTGPTGNTGPAGPQGDPGPQGTQGIPGPPGGLGEAPTDGLIYGRSNGAWVEAGGADLWAIQNDDWLAPANGAHGIQIESDRKIQWNFNAPDFYPYIQGSYGGLMLMVGNGGELTFGNDGGIAAKVGYYGYDSDVAIRIGDSARPTPFGGTIRYTVANKFEGYHAGAWMALGGGAAGCPLWTDDTAALKPTTAGRHVQSNGMVVAGSGTHKVRNGVPLGSNYIGGVTWNRSAQSTWDDVTKASYTIKADTVDTTDYFVLERQSANGTFTDLVFQCLANGASGGFDRFKIYQDTEFIQGIRENAFVKWGTGSWSPSKAYRHIVLDATGGNVTVNLPTYIGNQGRKYTFYRMDSSANTVTINTNSSQTILPGGTSITLTTTSRVATLVAAGSGSYGFDWLREGGI